MNFRKLNEAQKANFRAWARDNYVPGSEISELWHPVVREACAVINAAHTRLPPFARDEWVDETQSDRIDKRREEDARDERFGSW